MLESSQYNYENFINRNQKFNKQETRKNKLKENNNKKIWNIFDEECNSSVNIECVYIKEEDLNEEI